MKTTTYNRTLYATLITLFLVACGGGGGSDGANQTPTASFTASPGSGTAPLGVVVDASASTDTDGSIVGYAWDFGDGGNGSGVTSSTMYSNPGNYTITLTITDDAGDTGTATTTISVGTSAGSTTAIDQQIFEQYGLTMNSMSHTLAYKPGQATVMGNVKSGNHAMFLIAGQTIPPGAMMSGSYVLKGGFFIEAP